MAVIHNSILDNTKKLLGIVPDDDVFDEDIITHINSVFSRLQQLAVGDPEGFEITGRTETWQEFLGGNKLINNVKSYMFAQVKMYFDPPTTSFELTAKQSQIDKFEWLLNVAVDKTYGPLVGKNADWGTAFMWELEAENVFPPEAEEGDLGIYVPNKSVWRKS